MAIADLNAPVPKEDRKDGVEAGLWQGVKRLTGGAWNDFTFVANAAFIGALGTVIVSFLQYFSAYQDRVATLAKEDLAVATTALTDALNTVSLPLTLQERLVFAYLAATDDQVRSDERAYATSSARGSVRNYYNGFDTLREQIMPLAVKMQLYLDLPSDPNAGPSQILSKSVHSLTVPLLGYYNFDCDRDFAAFDRGGSVLTLKDPASGPPLEIDWYSARTQLLTLDYCIEKTHAALGPILRWADAAASDRPQAADPPNTLTAAVHASLMTRFRGQIRRFNGFVSLAIYEMQRFRVKYQPEGFVCSLPLVSGVVALFDRCAPRR